VTAAVGFALVLCATLASAGAGPHAAAASIAAAVAPVSAEALALTTQIAGLQADLANITGKFLNLIKMLTHIYPYHHDPLLFS
jgi:hypothetical protein